jgi:HEAT repeats
MTTTSSHPSIGSTVGRADENKRSRKVYVLWVTALVLLLSMSAFCWLVVAPYLQTRAAVQRCHADPDRVRSEIEKLGGPERAARRVSLYLRTPGFLAPNRLVALEILCECDEAAIPELVKLLGGDEEVHVRWMVAVTLARLKDAAAIDPLIARLKNKRLSPSDRRMGQTHLAVIGPTATSALEGLLKNEDPFVRQEARAALDEIRAVQRNEILYIVLSGSYRKIPPGRAARELKAWIANIMQRSDSPEGPSSVSPWDPDCTIWEHRQGWTNSPSRCFTIVPDGDNFFLVDNQRSWKPVKASELRVFKRILQESSIVIYEYRKMPVRQW